MRAIIVITVMLLMAASAMAGNTIMGTVINGKGEPVTNAVVSAQIRGADAPIYTVTDKTGMFTYKNVPLGVYSIYAQYQDNISEKQTYLNHKFFTSRLILTLDREEGSSDSGPRTTLLGNRGMLEAHR